MSSIIAYILAAISAIGTIVMVIETPMIIPIFIVIWGSILYIGCWPSRNDPEPKSPGIHLEEE